MSALLLLLLIALATARGAKRKPTREQPHVVLEGRDLNTFETPEFHSDPQFVSHGADTLHQFIVQLKAPASQSRQQIESDLQVKFGNYMPHNSYMLYVTEADATRIRAHSLTLWLGAFLPKYKIASVLFRDDVNSVLDHDLFRFVVHYAGSESSELMADRFRQRVATDSPAGVDITKIYAISDSNLYVFAVEFAAHGNEHARRVAAYLAMQPEVHFIEPVGPRKQHNVEIVKLDIFDGATPITTQITGAGVVLGVVDSGIDGSSCHFPSGKILNPEGAVPDPHGTAVAAIAAGASGIASGAKIFFVSVQNSIPLTGISAKLNAAVAMGAYTVVNAGGAMGSSYSMAAAEMDKFAVENDRVLMIVSAGNGPLSSSAYSKNALVVGSTEIGASRTTVAADSARTGTKDYRFKPDVVSDGSGVFVSGCQMLQLNDGSTSAAAATAAGAALLVRQYFSDGWWGTGGLTEDSKNIGFLASGALIKATLAHAAAPISIAKDAGGGAAGGGESPSVVQGFGRIELSRALWFNTTSPFKTMTKADDNELDVGAQFRICIQVSGTGPLRVTIAWHDVAADVAAGHTLVNDLDLVVFDANSGQEWRGNNAAGFDHSNNIERVEFVPPKMGGYVVVVYGLKLNTKTKFGLIMTGDYKETPCVEEMPDQNGNYVPSYPFPKCPNGCSSFTHDCNNGICICNGQSATGVDCSLTTCSADCGADGECDYALGACRCIQGKRGDRCAFAFTDVAPEEVFKTVSQDIYQGKPVGLFAGLFVFLYLIGCIAAAICGIVCGQKYLEHKRDSAARA